MTSVKKDLYSESRSDFDGSQKEVVVQNMTDVSDVTDAALNDTVDKH